MSTLRAVRALAHPLWWAALALLLLNDHVLKGGPTPGWLTGKLSDCAGMLVAPALLAALLGVRTRAGLAAAHGAVGAWFAAINLMPAAARAWESLWAASPFPWAITVDPSDLLVLPLLGVSFALFARACARPVAVRPTLARLGLAVGSFACMATSPPPDGPYVNQPQPTFFPTAYGRLAIANRTGVSQVVRVRALAPEVTADCAAVQADPTGVLTAALFGPAETWLLEGGRALVLADAPCLVYLVDGPGLPLRLITTAAFAGNTLPTQTSQISAEVGLFFDATADGMAWVEHPALRILPDADTASATCAPVPDGFGVSWSLPPIGEGQLLAHQVAADGCHAFDVLVSGTQSRWFVCMPAMMLPFAPGDAVHIVPVTTGAAWQAVDGVQVVGPRGRLVLTRGADLPDVVGSDVRTTLDPECPRGGRDACGGLTLALEVDFVDPEGEHVQARVGEVLHIGNADLAIGRAVQPVVQSAECTLDQTVGAPFIEAAAVEWLAR